MKIVSHKNDENRICVFIALNYRPYQGIQDTVLKYNIINTEINDFIDNQLFKIHFMPATC